MCAYAHTCKNNKKCEKVRKMTRNQTSGFTNNTLLQKKNFRD